MLSYRIRKATTGVAPHPCIFLHGYGSNADDLFYFAGYLPDQLTVISLEAPLDTPFGGKAGIRFTLMQHRTNGRTLKS